MKMSKEKRLLQSYLSQAEKCRTRKMRMKMMK